MKQSKQKNYFLKGKYFWSEMQTSNRRGNFFWSKMNRRKPKMTWIVFAETCKIQGKQISFHLDFFCCKSGQPSFSWVQRSHSPILCKDTQFLDWWLGSSYSCLLAISPNEGKRRGKYFWIQMQTSNQRRKDFWRKMKRSKRKNDLICFAETCKIQGKQISCCLIFLLQNRPTLIHSATKISLAHPV